MQSEHVKLAVQVVTHGHAVVPCAVKALQQGLLFALPPSPLFHTSIAARLYVGAQVDDDATVDEIKKAYR